MNPNLFLKISILILFGLSAATVLLPDEIARSYTLLMMLGSLFLGSVFSFRISITYVRELRRVFLFLSVFILFLFLANIEWFWYAISGLAGNSPYTQLMVAAVAYIILLLVCVNVLKITNLNKLDKKEWMLITSMSFLGFFIIVYFFTESKELSMDFVRSVLFRIIDVFIVLMLLPVVMLYRKQSQVNRAESITFTLVIVGIIISTIGDYIYAIITAVSYSELSRSFHEGSILDAIYVFSYLLIMIGLYAHLNYQNWTLKKIDVSRVDIQF